MKVEEPIIIQKKCIYLNMDSHYHKVTTLSQSQTATFASLLATLLTIYP